HVLRACMGSKLRIEDAWTFGLWAKRWVRPRPTLDVMCGRVRLSSEVSEIKLVFGIAPERPIPNFPPSWNAAPTDSLPVVRFDSKAGQRSLDMLSCCVGYVHHKEVPNFDS